jgi:hypothetical protein
MPESRRHPAGNQTFRWVGTAPLSGASEVGYFTSAGTTINRAAQEHASPPGLRIPVMPHRRKTVLFVLARLALVNHANRTTINNSASINKIVKPPCV